MHELPLTPPQAVTKITGFLERKNIQGNLKFQAELMVAEVLQCDRMGIYLRYDAPLNNTEKQQLRDISQRRVAGEPLEYILGKAYFFGYGFVCLPGVLIPRPDTEELVAETLEVINTVRAARPQERLSVWEIGCGTGAVALAIALESQNLDMLLTDISDDAINNTQKNIARYSEKLNAAGNRVDVRQEDIFTGVGTGKSFDVVISNPPYVSEEEYAQLADEAKCHEPKAAFTDSGDGLRFYRFFAANVAPTLDKSGQLLVECGFSQRKAITQIFEESDLWKTEKVRVDINGKDRVIRFSCRIKQQEM